MAAMGRTVDSEIAQCRTRRALHLDVGILEEEQDGLQRVAVNLSYIALRYLGERQARRPLQVDVVGVHQGAECAQRLAGEEVGLGSLWESA
jgi:hypothetical protein